MAKAHGRKTYFALDNPSGALQAIGTSLTSISKSRQRDQPTSPTFGDVAQRRETPGLRSASFSGSGYFRDPASAKKHGKSARVLLNQYAVHRFFNSVSVERSADWPETTTFKDPSTDVWKEFDVLGLADGSLGLQGLFHDAAAEADAILKSVLASETPGVATVGLAGLAIGALVEMAKLTPESYDSDGSIDSVVSAAAQLPVDDRVDLGVSQHDLVQESAVGDYASVDWGEATTEGGVGHLHVSAVTAVPAADIRIQDSVDDAVWTDLITFAAASVVGHQRIEVSGAVKRYTRAQIAAITISTDITFAVAFAKRGYLTAPAGTHKHFFGIFGRDASVSFEYGPAGNASGKPKETGECRVTSYSLEASVEGVITFSTELQVTGAITEASF